MANDEARVNHPSYYEKKVTDNRVHPECIELLDVITRGLPGILALDIGQLKYCYRFGSKAEEGLSRKDKAAEDTRKIVWYAKDYKKRLGDFAFERIEFTNAEATIAALIAEEFAFDKPESIKAFVRDVIIAAYKLKTTCGDVNDYVSAVERLAEAVENSKDEEWN